MSANYPPITLGSVKALDEILTNYKKQGKAYLQDSPYASDIILAITGLTLVLRNNSVDTSEPVGDVDVTKEMDQLYSSLKNFQGAEDLAPTERVAVLRIQTNLLEKVIEMRERAIGISNYIAFRETLMEVIADKFSPDELNVLKERLSQV